MPCGDKTQRLWISWEGARKLIEASDNHSAGASLDGDGDNRDGVELTVDMQRNRIGTYKLEVILARNSFQRSESVFYGIVAFSKKRQRANYKIYYPDLRERGVC